MNEHELENIEEFDIIEEWGFKEGILGYFEGVEQFIFDKKARIISFKDNELVIGIAPGYKHLIPKLEDYFYDYLRRITDKEEDNYKLTTIDDPQADKFKVELEDRMIEVYQSILNLKEFIEIEENENTKISNHCRTWGKDVEIYEWEKLRFRAPHEIKIAQVLDNKKILFWANSACRFGKSERKNSEPDFLICYEGKWGILEIDSPSTHQYLTKDADRDRMLKQHGIKVMVLPYLLCQI
ncbi:MAG: hypothetical protein HEQ13_18345 [Dolichospermum sp. DEX189]|jgi:hypothetical protein|uniref:DUF559 domain-containing protein n=1 Tax=Aphanizomenon flos-aquae FACHB-1040 TaxID=2692887 RepID=A0ABR8BWG8_APHFL|nr:hypothetical protein [Aphanizomenon flos-aquae]MBD2277759.1 hypothetical protein [Aphanizomenon flos-aquae FACHB-1040]MBO1071194.1 hypothetical protein [Dolichospermum sp. DEX189]